MELLTCELRRILPPLYAQENVPDPIVFILCFAQHKMNYVALTFM
jgi:hypothetical protein